MGTTWRRIACAAALACALPIHAADIPTVSDAWVGAMRFTVTDTNLDDGIDAGYTLLGVSGTYAERTVTEAGESSYSWGFDPAGGANSMFSQSDGIEIRSFASTFGDGVIYADAIITDTWALTLAPNTAATIQIDAAADPTGGTAFAWAGGVMGNQSFGDGLSSGAATLSFQIASGASELTGIITRNAATTAALFDGGVIPQAPEPSTALLVLLGLGGLAMRGRRTRR